MLFVRTLNVEKGISTQCNPDLAVWRKANTTLQIVHCLGRKPVSVHQGLQHPFLSKARTLKIRALLLVEFQAQPPIRQL